MILLNFKVCNYAIIYNLKSMLNRVLFYNVNNKSNIIYFYYCLNLRIEFKLIKPIKC